MRLSRLTGAIDRIIKAKEVSNSNNYLRECVDSICSSFLVNWEKEHLPGIRNLSESVRRGVPTPVLSICGRGTREIRWTKYLSYYLNPNARHGLGDRLAIALLDRHLGSQLGAIGTYQVKCVEDEVYIGSVQGNGSEAACFCDIVIFTDRFNVFVEQKILSGESNSSSIELGQLERYSRAIKTNKAFSSLQNYKLYLTPTGVLPHKVKDWIPIKHSDVIKCGKKLLSCSELSSVARGNLYRFLIDLATGPYQVDEDLDKLLEMADILIKDGFNLNAFVQYRKLRNRHSDFIGLIGEGLA